ncbi:MAG: thiamine phosphate synthase, partial [Myxococcales bacterium]|nr:thiamine phosphate synthase [Myxococcales bacterium]
HLGGWESSGPLGPAARSRETCPDKLIGRSCHTASEVWECAEAGLDYVTLSPVFESKSKSYPHVPVEESEVRGAAGAPVLVYTLGGVTPERILPVRSAGVFGVAVMGDICRSKRPGLKVEAFIAALDAVG